MSPLGMSEPEITIPSSPPKQNRLHANLLFYGLDEGTWGEVSPSNGNWSTTPSSQDPDSTWMTPTLPQKLDSIWSSPTAKDPDRTWTTPKSIWSQSSTTDDQSSDEQQKVDKGSDSDRSLTPPKSCPENWASPSSGQYLATSPFAGGAHTMLPYVTGYDGNLAADVAGTYLPYNPHSLPLQHSQQQQPLQHSGGFSGFDGFGTGVGGLADVDILSIGHMHSQAAAMQVGHGIAHIDQHGPGGSNGTFEAFAEIGTGEGTTADDAAVEGNIVATVNGVEVDAVPSIGSYAHLSGQCSRCCFHPKGRCSNGYSCQFCHYDHEKRPRNGKKKHQHRW
eukprot:gnl/TRDRNA2_/TRDRNA2_53574_c0_seq1.p1 gnl/TRDRNA2_/TRDRNA2_53574_c0~~gnl/TRDRNA2_/TRDRNA2_53574_c0_seq1.p1  ORF type:complete len:334 (-),score=44.47 gnl/TRDRNA2_/TRDRNA2_53574_c0_seq1:157-1158(-)